MTHPARPSTIDCQDWTPDANDPNGRRCAHYAGPSGRCEQRNAAGDPVRLLCSEWLKRQPVKNVARPPTDTAPPALASVLAPPPPKDAPTEAPPIEPPDAPLRLVPPAPKPRKASDVARELLAQGPRRSAAPAIPDMPDGPAIVAIDPAAVDALAAAHAEITLYSEELGGSITLVSTPTGKDRTEITFKDLATLTTLVSSLPGARVLALAKKPK